MCRRACGERLRLGSTLIAYQTSPSMVRPCFMTGKKAIGLASDQVRHLPVCGSRSAQCAMSVLLRCSKISAATLPMLVKQDKSMPVIPSKPGIPSL